MVKVLLVGSGAREHAIAYALTKNIETELYSCQGYSNYGIKECSKKILETETDYEQIVEFAKKNQVDFAFIGPEAQLRDGLVDILESNGIPCASPTRMAARIESDKMFMRELLDKYFIDGRINYLVTENIDEALQFCSNLDWKVAVKPIGLTAGKGVKVWGDHLKNEQEVSDYIKEIISNGISGYSQVLIEELLIGQEFTIHFFSDGKNAYPSIPIQDHKRAFNEDQGPNTGGMGAYSDKVNLPFLSQEDLQAAYAIGNNVIAALSEEGCPFKGILYGQFILTQYGIKIIEFNSRFGDPEAMNTLTLLESDFTEICKNIINGSLMINQIVFKKQASLCVYIVPAGYGIDPKENEKIVISSDKIKEKGARVFFGSCNFVDSYDGIITVSTTKSRTFGICALGENLEDAFGSVSQCFQHINGNVHYRTDIGSTKAITNKITMVNKFRKQ